MLIVHQNNTRAYNSDSFEAIYVDTDYGKWAILGFKHESIYSMATYDTKEEAEAEFTRLMSAINNNNAKVFFLK